MIIATIIIIAFLVLVNMFYVSVSICACRSSENAWWQASPTIIGKGIHTHRKINAAGSRKESCHFHTSSFCVNNINACCLISSLPPNSAFLYAPSRIAFLDVSG